MIQALWDKYGLGSGRFTSSILVMLTWVMVLFLGFGVLISANSLIEVKQPDEDWQPIVLETEEDRVRAQRAVYAFEVKVLEPMLLLNEGNTTEVTVRENDLNAWMALSMEEWARKNKISPGMLNIMSETHVKIDQDNIKLMTKLNLRGQSQPVSFLLKPVRKELMPEGTDHRDQQPDRDFYFQNVQRVDDFTVYLQLVGVSIGKVEASLTSIISLLSEHSNFLNEAKTSLLQEAAVMTEEELNAALVEKFGSKAEAEKALVEYINRELASYPLVIPMSLFGGDGKVNINDMTISNDGQVRMLVTKQGEKTSTAPADTPDPQG